jgi:hypothetical protein
MSGNNTISDGTPEMAGRPKSEKTKDRPFSMRVDEEWEKGVDELRKREADLPSRAEMVRRLIEREVARGAPKAAKGRSR